MMNVPNPCGPKSVRRKSSWIRGGDRQTNAFTLVEMLVVVSIILLVAVVALPGISSLSKSASRRSAVSVVLGALDAARAQAISQSSNCFIVFANGDAKLPEQYRFRAFAIFQETYIPPPASDPAAPPYHLVVVRPWTLLPEGVAFRPDIAAEGASPVSTIFSAPKRVFFCKPAAQDVNLPYIRFNSLGAVETELLESSSSPTSAPLTAEKARLKIFEGFVDPNGNVTGTNSAKEVADETITVSLFTGRAKREEVKIDETHAPS